MAERPLGREETRGYPTYAGGSIPGDYQKDRVRWGPIWAGVFTTLSVAILLGLLGLAVGAAVFDPAAAQQQQEGFGWGFAIWGVIVLIVSFGAGGWIAAQSSSLGGSGTGLLNGAMVWAVAVPAMFFLLPFMFGMLMGPAAMLAQGVATEQQPGMEQIFAIPGDEQDPEQMMDPEQAEQAQEAVNIATWGTLIGLLLALAAAAGAGVAGAKGEHLRPGPPQDRGYGEGPHDQGRTHTTQGGTTIHHGGTTHGGTTTYGTREPEGGAGRARRPEDEGGTPPPS